MLFRTCTDVFMFLFGGKGLPAPEGMGKLYSKKDFSIKPDWFVCYDKLGNGCRV